MPTEASPRRQPRPSRGGGGGGFWLGLAVVVGGIGAVYVFAPDLPSRIFGGSSSPGPGDEPSVAQTSNTTIDTREQTATNALTAPSAVARTSTTTAKAAPVATTAAPDPSTKTYADEAKAQTFLAQAEEAYKAAPTIKDWSKATSAARKIIGLNAKPATIVRAKDIIRGSEAMAKLFKDLADRDELQRNYDTDPQLVMIGTGPTASYAVPITSMDNIEVVKGDPVAWINGQRASGKITVLLRGKKDFIPASLPSDQVTTVERAKVDEIIAAKQKEFEERLARLKNGALADNALAWYDAAKFAYQNRLDATVAAMMDRALILDPLLAGSVREDKAAGLFANVVLHLNNRNVKQAAAFMKIITERFADTPSGLQARAFYDSKTKESADDVAKAQEALRAARRDAAAREAEEARKRREQRVARAKETGDEQEIAAAEKQAPAEEDTPDAAAPISGDEGKADELYAKGEELYKRAIDAGNSSGRDQLYEECNKYLTQAQNLYNQLLEKNPGNTALEEKAFMCNKLRYGSIKQRRFH